MNFVCPDQQDVVDARFNAERTVWRDASKRRDMFGIIYRGRQSTLLEMVDQLNLPSQARVLDVGCGSGPLALSLANRGFEVEAIDHASEMVDVARAEMELAGVENKVRVSVGDAHNLSYPDGSFDLIVGLGVVVWLHNLCQALSQLKRVLKKGGYLALSVDNFYSFRLVGLFDVPGTIRSAMRRAIKLDSLQKTSLPTPKPHFYSIKEFNRYLSEAGLRKLKHASFGFEPMAWDGRELFPKTNVSINLRLQEYSTGKLRFLENFASQIVFLATKP